MRDDVGALIGSADWSPSVRGAPPSIRIDLFLELKVGRFELFGVCPAFRPGLASTCFTHLVLRVPLASSRGCISTKCAAPWVETVSGPRPRLRGRRHLALRPACSETPLWAWLAEELGEIWGRVEHSGSAGGSSTLEQESRRSRWCRRPDGTSRLGCPSTRVRGPPAALKRP